MTTEVPTPAFSVNWAPRVVGSNGAHPAGDDAPLGELPLRERIPRIDWHELWAREDTEEWIVEPILPARRLVAIYSAPKVGKSLLVLEIAVAVSRGTEVLGTTPDRARRVLYVDYENDPRGDIYTRLVDMGRVPDDLEMLDYLSYPPLGGLDTHAGSDRLLECVTEYQSEVVIIDTVSRTVEGEENSNDTWLKFYNRTAVKLKRLGVALIRLDHSGKDAEKGQRGGSAKSGDVDAVWRLSRVEGAGEMYRLECEDSRMMVNEKTLILHRETEPLHHRVDADGARAAFQAKVRIALSIADGAELENGATNRLTREAIVAGGMRVRNDVVAEVVRVRKARGVLPDWAATEPPPNTP